MIFKILFRRSIAAKDFDLKVTRQSEKQQLTLFMKNLFSTFIVILFLSCGNLFESNNNKAIESSKKYTEDYYFKKNMNVDFLEFKLIKLEELDINTTDSMIRRIVKNKLLTIALQLNGQDPNSPNFLAPNLQEDISIASNSKEFTLFSAQLKSYMQNPGFIAHVYSKYTVKQGENTENKLYEDRQYFLSHDFKTLAILQ